MAIDTSIYGQLRPIEAPNMLTQYGQIAQIQNAQNQNRLADLAFGEKQRELAETQRYNDAYKSALGPDGKLDRTLLTQVLANGGLGSKLPAVMKTFTEQDKAQGEIDAKALDMAAKRYGIYKQTLGALANEPGLSKDMVIRSGQELVQQGILPFAMYQNAIGNLPDDPAQLRAKLLQGVKSQLTPEQMFTVFAPRPTERDDGQRKWFEDANPNSPTFGQMVGGAPVQKQMTPGEMATDRRVGAQLAQAERHFQAGQNAPQYMETEQGVVALPKKPVAGQPIVGEVVNGPDGKPLQKKVNLPQYVVQGLAENEKTAGVIEKALAQLQTPEGKNAVGFKGYLPQPILNRIDPKGVNTRADISDIGSMTVKDRSGATVTVAESPRLMPFIPAATDDDATARKKLSRMLQLIREDSEALTAFHPGAKDALAKVRAGKAGASPATKVPTSGVKFLGFE